MTAANIAENQLIRKAQAGDSAAFGELVMAYQRFVYNLALRSLGDEQEAQDMAQEAFLRAWQALPRFRGECRFSTWLYRIAVNLCFNCRPRLRRELAALPVDEVVEDSYLTETHASPDRAVEHMEERSLVQQQIGQLPESYRLLITLRYQQELSYEEIAQVLCVPLGTVKTGLFRARAQLRHALLAHQDTLQEAG